MDKTEATPGGLGSQEEMCVMFLLVYPSDCCTPPNPAWTPVLNRLSCFRSHEPTTTAESTPRTM